MNEYFVGDDISCSCMLFKNGERKMTVENLIVEEINLLWWNTERANL